MTPLIITITRAGLDRFTAAQLDDDLDLSIASVGLTDAAFAVAPTLQALPGEFRRLTAISGDQVGDNIVHMTVRDEEAVGYSARGFGLFLADGTMFGVYGQPERLFEKSPVATFLAAIDIVFPTGDVTELRFGNTDFLNPPATTEAKGVVELATPAEVVAGNDRVRAVTPYTLAQLLPVGTITLWSGAGGAPAGWAICDGREVARSDGSGRITTPDLRDRVPVGAGGAHQLGDRFGAPSMTVDTADGGAHAHTGTIQVDQAKSGDTVTTTTKSVDAGGSANNIVTGVTLNDPGHAHTASLSVDQAPAHRHKVTVDVVQPSFALFFIMRI